MEACDYVKLVIISFIGVFVINRALSTIGLDNYRT